MRMKKKVSNEIKPQNIELITDKTKNIYKSIFIISQRAKQINTAIKHKIDDELKDFVARTDKNDLNEICEDSNQIEFSVYNEKKPKPYMRALEEFQKNQILFHEKIVE